MTHALLTLTLLAGLLVACTDQQDPLTTGTPDASRPNAAVASRDESGGLGRKFELLFAMRDDQDPENATNDVISVLTTPTTIGAARRELSPGIKIAALDHRLNLKYYFPTAPRICSGGSPRVQLQIDGDGDGKWEQRAGGPDQNAFGYVGREAFGVGCLTMVWDIIDMTDDVGHRWDLSQLGGSQAMTWDEAEAFVTATYPNHQVLAGTLVDDSCGFAPTACGQAYYDLVTVENRTLENDEDTVN